MGFGDEPILNLPLHLWIYLCCAVRVRVCEWVGVCVCIITHSVWVGREVCVSECVSVCLRTCVSQRSNGGVNDQVPEHLCGRHGRVMIVGHAIRPRSVNVRQEGMR